MHLTIESPRIKASRQITACLQANFDYLLQMYDRIASCAVVLRKVTNEHHQTCLIEAMFTTPKRVVVVCEQADTFERAVYKIMSGLERQLSRCQREY